jgi:hypothetical protein
VVPVAATEARIGEAGSFPSAFASRPVPRPDAASANPAPEPIPRPVAESASPLSPEPDPAPASGADGLSAESEGNDWLATFGPFGSDVADRSGETVAGRSGALVDSGPGVAEDSGLAGVAGAPEPARVAEGRGPAGVAAGPGPAGAAEDPEPIGVADGSGSAGVDAGTGVEGGCEAATWVASGDDALGTPGEPGASEDAVRAEAEGGELAAVSAEDPDRGVTRTRAGVPM